jgi:hypothetical protein
MSTPTLPLDLVFAEIPHWLSITEIADLSTVCKTGKRIVDQGEILRLKREIAIAKFKKAVADVRRLIRRTYKLVTIDDLVMMLESMRPEVFERPLKRLPCSVGHPPRHIGSVNNGPFNDSVTLVFEICRCHFNAPLFVEISEAWAQDLGMILINLHIDPPFGLPRSSDYEECDLDFNDLPEEYEECLFDLNDPPALY